MNTTAIIISIIVFGIFSEILTWITKQSSLFIKAYVSVIRILTLILALSTILYIDIDSKDVTRLKEANDFKYECIQHLDSLRILQSAMIDSLANCLEEDYNCDIPQFDGDALDNIYEQEQIIDSLYKLEQ